MENETLPYVNLNIRFSITILFRTEIQVILILEFEMSFSDP